MKHVAGEPHLRRTERIIGGKAEDGRKHSSFKTGILRTPETQRAASEDRVQDRPASGKLKKQETEPHDQNRLSIRGFSLALRFEWGFHRF